MGIGRATALTCLLGIAPALAEERLPPLSCEGSRPYWQLNLTGDTAQFTFGKSVDMAIPQRTQAKDADFPQALTLIAQRDTAIVILNKRQCDTESITAFPFEANILTQKGEEPVILRGCCQIAQ